MKKFVSLTCLPLATLLCACSSAEPGHYDANGNYVPSSNPTRAERYHSPDSGSAYDDYYDNAPHHTVYKSTTTTYDYDPQNHITDVVTETDLSSIPRSMLPPHGLCRVWFPQRQPQDEPNIESCEGIRHRAPEGSYVIYGY